MVTRTCAKSQRLRTELITLKHELIVDQPTFLVVNSRQNGVVEELKMAKNSNPADAYSE
jgi:hypothetical protein